MKPIVEIKKIGKQYVIGENQRYLALRDILTNIIKSPLGWLLGKINSGFRAKTFWALKDINLEIKQGEILGVIGRNGAGKSTLLKILSRITPPTEGEICLRGRVGSLLEVGTGFHPELSGRENIMLNGAILGMRKKEIEEKFDEIVAFSGIGKFLDTPVKRYSSGMYVRLAFAVAAHLEPEILIVDEVLAVGDAEFQKKCLGKMEEVTKKNGRTVIFVSHNMAAVQSLCNRAIVLDEGKIIFDGNVKDAVNFYIEKNVKSEGSEWTGNSGDEDVRLTHTWVKSLDKLGSFHTAASIEIGLELDILNPVDYFIAGFTLFSEYENELAYVLYDDKENTSPPTIGVGKFKKKFMIPANTLAEGTYRIQFDIGVHLTKRIILKEGGLVFTLSNIEGLGRRFNISNVKGHSSLFRPDWAIHD